MKHFNRILPPLFLLTLLFSQVTHAFAEPIDEVREIIENYYIKEVPDSILNQPTIQDITSHLDPYSTYMTKLEYESFTQAIEQELVGIGIVIEEHDLGIMVLQTLEGGPANLAGIQAGDIIIGVDDYNLEGVSLQTAISYITGEENTSLRLTYIEKATGTTKSITVERKKISLPNVESKMLGGNIGYIRLNSFSLDAVEQIQSAIQSLQNPKGFIFDLRNNGGGYVSSAQNIIGLFPNAQYAFQLRERVGDSLLYQAIKQETVFTKPVHILVNQNSASASEMVSASIKEQTESTIYGQTTYGKGSMQSLFLLSDESVFKLTTARFFSPSGAEIDQVGVTPDIITEEGKELVQSHKDMLLNNYSHYKKLPTLANVPVDKTFTIKMNTQMNWEGATSKNIELIHLTGDAVETNLTIVDSKTVKLTSVKPLLSKEKYMLIIHPEWSSKTNRAMETGTLLEVNVE
ncbi:hypothetical protein GCM10008967_02630 [Bacillus carboniphilus]|uniref:PDZ domain-containing protein n=1 Tax=Bacillus carboniphilus TaxID=86663 RepID=A0ABP3FHZ7_9BACI